jgi:hypothetical protein
MRHLRILAALALFSTLAHASIASTAAWEVRPTVGSDTNGGGYDPAITGGTDYSQQNSKNSSGSNISTADAACTGGTTLTSSTAAFTAAIKGNIIYLTGTSVTTGWYEVTAYGSATSVTLDRSPGTFTGATMNIGGALATTLSALGSGATLPYVAYNTIWVKATGTLTVSTTLSLQGSTNSNLNFIGYTSTRGDGGRATWTTATNSTYLIEGGYNNTNGILFENFTFTNTAGTPYDGIYVQGTTFEQLMIINCSFSGFRNAINGSNDSSGGPIYGLFVINSEVANSTNIGIWTSQSTWIQGSYIHGNTTSGVTIQSNQTATFVVTQSILASNGIGLAIQDDQSKMISVSSTAFYDNTGDGLQGTTGSTNGSPISLYNNVFFGNGGYGIDYQNVPSNVIPFVTANAFGSNTSGSRHNFAFGSTTDVSLSGDPFVAGGSANFALNSTAGAGAAARSAGFPGALNNGGTGYIDIGPLQHSGGGSNPVGYVFQ